MVLCRQFRKSLSQGLQQSRRQLMVKLAALIAHQRTGTFQLKKPAQRLGRLVRTEFIDLEDGTGDARNRMICNRA
tara:strand:- start:995 stop:1219 length:225 start_codon:yes stop_codon:yes gene_type:complete